jgi:hypothetical protein
MAVIGRTTACDGDHKFWFDNESTSGELEPRMRRLCLHAGRVTTTHHTLTTIAT